MVDPLKTRHGRGTGENPKNRFQRLNVLYEPSPEDGPPLAEPTQLYRDATRSILAENDSPDLGFRYSLNPYRGCEHGCVYCYARPSHEFLGFSAGLDFETKITVKHDAPALLRKALSAPKWQPETIALSGNTDCYQPVERKLRVTRGCLEVFAEFLQPVSLITKSALVMRDIDLLAPLARAGATRVFLSLTTLDADLAGALEPRAARPTRRLEAIRALTEAGIPVSVMVAPLIPGLNDREVPSLLAAAKEAGALTANWVLLRLPAPVDALFSEWLTQHRPDAAARVLGLIRDCRDGALSDSTFGRRMRGEGAYAEQIGALFRATARKLGLDGPLPPLSGAHFRRQGQLSLF